MNKHFSPSNAWKTLKEIGTAPNIIFIKLIVWLLWIFAFMETGNISSILERTYNLNITNPLDIGLMGFSFFCAALFFHDITVFQKLLRSLSYCNSENINIPSSATVGKGGEC